MHHGISPVAANADVMVDPAEIVAAACSDDPVAAAGALVPAAVIAAGLADVASAMDANPDDGKAAHRAGTLAAMLASGHGTAAAGDPTTRSAVAGLLADRTSDDAAHLGAVIALCCGIGDPAAAAARFDPGHRIHGGGPNADAHLFAAHRPPIHAAIRTASAREDAHGHWLAAAMMTMQGNAPGTGKPPRAEVLATLAADADGVRRSLRCPGILAMALRHPGTVSAMVGHDAVAAAVEAGFDRIASRSNASERIIDLLGAVASWASHADVVGSTARLGLLSALAMSANDASRLSASEATAVRRLIPDVAFADVADALTKQSMWEPWRAGRWSEALASAPPDGTLPADREGLLWKETFGNGRAMTAGVRVIDAVVRGHLTPAIAASRGNAPTNHGQHSFTGTRLIHAFRAAATADDAHRAEAVSSALAMAGLAPTRDLERLRASDPAVFVVDAEGFRAAVGTATETLLAGHGGAPWHVHAVITGAMLVHPERFDDHDVAMLSICRATSIGDRAAALSAERFGIPGKNLWDDFRRGDFDGLAASKGFRAWLAKVTPGAKQGWLDGHVAYGADDIGLRVLALFGA